MLDVSIPRPAFGSLVKDVALYTNFCNAACLLLLQNKCTLCCIDDGKSSTNVFLQYIINIHLLTTLCHYP